MARRKEPQHRPVERCFAHRLRIGHEGAARARGPFGGKIGPGVLAFATFTGAQELARSAAQREIEREIDQLLREVGAPERLLRSGHVSVGFPVAIRVVAVNRRRSRVSQSRGADDADRLAMVERLLRDRFHHVTLRRSAIAARHVGRGVDHADPRLGPGVERGRGARTVGDLRIGVVGLDQRDIVELFEAERIFLARLALLLPGKDARGGYR